MIFCIMMIMNMNASGQSVGKLATFSGTNVDGKPARNVLVDGKESCAVGVDEPRLLAVFGERGARKACVVKVHVAHLLDVAVSDVAPHC